ncbi:hypothetical protein GOBAR_AA31210 [Gossypium barbadense]|uniref:Uncharacterized protein n=1 Tax=Gossypium barbadense TaxID=3634 RepID=A0A2P5WEG2_GOSBA|nr:hypothetical protein GOBAR_AA31210 [Gossypium barbadense]
MELCEKDTGGNKAPPLRMSQPSRERSLARSRRVAAELKRDDMGREPRTEITILRKKVKHAVTREDDANKVEPPNRV